MTDAIVTLGLQTTLHCFNELSIFGIRPDIWVIQTSYGNPIGVVEVKKPNESKDKWDLLKVVSTIRGEDAFRPESEGNCKLVAK